MKIADVLMLIIITIYNFFIFLPQDIDYILVHEDANTEMSIKKSKQFCKKAKVANGGIAPKVASRFFCASLGMCGQHILVEKSTVVIVVVVVVTCLNRIRYDL